MEAEFKNIRLFGWANIVAVITLATLLSVAVSNGQSLSTDTLGFYAIMTAFCGSFCIALALQAHNLGFSLGASLTFRAASFISLVPPLIIYAMHLQSGGQLTDAFYTASVGMGYMAIVFSIVLWLYYRNISLHYESTCEKFRIYMRYDDRSESEQKLIDDIIDSSMYIQLRCYNKICKMSSDTEGIFAYFVESHKNDKNST
jgi:hypothetical protein